MTWSTTAPDGSKSVKANKSIIQDNFTYIQQTMGNQVVGTNPSPQTALDHFWNIGANEDGHHRFIQTVGFVDSTPQVSAIPVRSAGMDCVLYAKETNDTVQWFHKNEDVNTNIYQVTPTQLKGTIVLTASYTNVVAVPGLVYGEITMFTDTLGSTTMGRGFFKSTAARCDAWAYGQNINDADAEESNLKFGNGNAFVSGLNIRARTSEATAGLTWNYIITYRAI